MDVHGKRRLTESAPPFVDALLFFCIKAHLFFFFFYQRKLLDTLSADGIIKP